VEEPHHLHHLKDVTVKDKQSEDVEQEEPAE